MYILIRYENYSLMAIGNAFPNETEAWQAMRDDLLSINNAIRKEYEDLKDENGHAYCENYQANFYIHGRCAWANTDEGHYSYKIFEITKEGKILC